MADNEAPAGLIALLNAMHAGDAEQAATHLADNITLKSPIFVEPFIGREQAKIVIGHLLKAVDSFDSTEILSGNGKFAVLLKIKVGDTDVEGVDIVGVNAEGKVDSMTIQWRPLPAIVAVQNRLAPRVGVPLLTLVEAS